MSDAEQPRTPRTPRTESEATKGGSANKVVKTANTTANTRKFDTRTSTLNVVWVPLLCYPIEMRENAPRIGIARPRYVPPPRDFLEGTYRYVSGYQDDVLAQCARWNGWRDESPMGHYACELFDIVAWLLWQGSQEEQWHLNANGLPTYGDGCFTFRGLTWQWRVDIGGGLEATISVWNTTANVSPAPHACEYWGVCHAPT